MERCRKVTYFRKHVRSVEGRVGVNEGRGSKQDRS